MTFADKSANGVPANKSKFSCQSTTENTTVNRCIFLAVFVGILIGVSSVPDLKDNIGFSLGFTYLLWSMAGLKVPFKTPEFDSNK